MAVVKTKEKKESNYIGIRVSTEFQNRVDNVFNACLAIQDIKKAELIRDAIERGLDAIEKDLMNATKS